MALSCEKHTAFIYDRGGLVQIGAIYPLIRVKWARERDDISSAMAEISMSSADCLESTLSLLAAGRSELVIFRGLKRVWEGPVTRIVKTKASIEIHAKDVMHYVYRTVMHAEYDNRYPNHGPILERVERILQAELARKEALSPAVNIVPHLQFITTPDDPGTTAHTLPYQYTVFEHLDAMSARSGIDYTVIGRSIVFFDVHAKIGQTPTVTEDDFLGDVIVTEYGMELGTHAYVTDGKGTFGKVGEADPYYGEWEILDTAYDESDEDAEEQAATGESVEVSVAELTSQAQRNLSGRLPAPTTVRIPAGGSLNPNGVLTFEDLVPGVWIPLAAKLPGKQLSQMQKLDQVTVEESSEGEVIGVTMSPAPSGADLSYTTTAASSLMTFPYGF